MLMAAGGAAGHDRIVSGHYCMATGWSIEEPGGSVPEIANKLNEGFGEETAASRQFSRFAKLRFDLFFSTH
jgi:hypothetical protein